MGDRGKDEEDEEDVLILLALVFAVTAPEAKPHLCASSLHSPLTSGLQKLISVGSDTDFLCFFRVDRMVWSMLLHEFGPRFVTTPLRDREYSSPTRRCITAELNLGLVLRYLASGLLADDQSLQLGITASSRSVYLSFGMSILVDILEHQPEARISLPDVETARLFSFLLFYTVFFITFIVCF